MTGPVVGMQRSPSRLRAIVLSELCLIGAATWVFARPLLDLRPDTVPIGREYASSVHAFHFWTRVKDCLACALWNGSIQGGYPALAELHAGILHPVAAGLTLLLGVPVGLKLATATAFFSAGLAQWWIAVSLRLGRVARLWSACMAVAAGNLAGRMEAGMVNLVLSGGACALALAAGVHLAVRPGRKPAVLLGLLLAAAFLSGQVYLQVGLLAALPLLLVLAAAERRRQLGADLLLAAGLALLLAAPLWLPALRLLPALDKAREFPLLSPQPFRWVPLNLLIDDPYLYLTRTLGMLDAPSLYHNYIGWLPVLLALFAAFAALPGPGRRRRRSRFLLAGALWMLLLGSREPWLLLQQAGGDGPVAHWVAGFRNPSFIAGLALPFVLGLAASGADLLLRRRGSARRAPVRWWQPSLSTGLSWVLLLMMLTSLADVMVYNRHWLKTMPWPADLPEVLQFLRASDRQWVSTPFAEDLYTEPAIRAGLKLSDAWQPWTWKDRQGPRPIRMVRRTSDLEGLPPDAELKGRRGDLMFYSLGPTATHYAEVARSDGQRVSCRSQGSGGNVDLHCPSDSAGLLTVQEHAWPGWRAEVDGQPATLLPDDWIRLVLPAGGQGRVRLRYRPWDAQLGLFLAALGAFGCWIMIRRAPRLA